MADYCCKGYLSGVRNASGCGILSLNSSINDFTIALYQFEFEIILKSMVKTRFSNCSRLANIF